MMHCTDHTSC